MTYATVRFWSRARGVFIVVAALACYLALGVLSGRIFSRRDVG